MGKLALKQIENNDGSISNLLEPPFKKIKLTGRNLILSSIQESHITSQYLGWLINDEVNEFLEVRKYPQSFESIKSYINHLRKKSECDLLVILSKDGYRHIGNVSITEMSESTGRATYGIMVGERSDPLSNIAGGESTLLIIDYFFSHQFIEEIKEGAHSDNVRARALLTKIGFLPLTEVPDNDGITRFALTRATWERNYNKFSPLYKSFI